MKISIVLLAGAGVLAVVLAIALLRWLMACNRRPEGPERVVALLLGLVIAESAIYENQDTIPTSLFHLQLGSVSFRLYDVLVPLAVIARLLARPRARARPLQVGLWGLFLLWYLAEMVEGVIGGNPKDFLTYEGKAIIYLGTFMLVAAVPVRRWVESPLLRRIVVAASAVALLLIVTSEAGVSINAHLPVVPLVGFGDLGADAASVFIILGTVTLALGICREHGRLPTILVALPLLASPVAAGQRAALIELGVSVILMVGLLVLRPGLVKVTPIELGWALTATAAVVAALVVVSAVAPSAHVSVPFASELNATFNSVGKQESAQDRVNQWAQARPLIGERPFYGWGLGKTYAYYSPGFYMFMPTDLTHNIVLDLLLRAGLVGLLLFVVAWLASLQDLWVTVRTSTDPRLTALAAGVGAAFVGIVVKGQFESIFEKYRIAMMMGLLIGVAASFGSERLAPESQPLPVDVSRPVELLVS